MMKITSLLALSIGLMLSLSNSKLTAATSPLASVAAAAVVDPAPAVHGMVLFGTDQLYASHVPMYMVPHDWQALLKVKISHATLDAMATYTKANIASKQVYFTLAPKPFVLPKLLDGRISSFKADLYKGSFENGGKVLLSNITVDVEEVSYVSHLSKSTEALDALTYFSIKAGTSTYLAHQISSPNNFDHIVQVEWLTPEVEAPAASSVAQSSVTARSFQLKDSETNRLKVGQYFQVTADGSIVATSASADASFRVVSDFYCTKGPDFYNLCAK